jgi:peptidoglycan hydrolase CwlO-like protein
MSDLIIEQLLAACGHTAEAKAAADEIERLQQGIVSLRVAHKEATDRCAELEDEIERLKKELELKTPKGLQHD